VSWPRLALWIAITGVCAACAGSGASAFAKDRAAAERAYAAGRYIESARYWQAAAEHAKSPGWARKAQQRQAMSLLRGGDWQTARAVLGKLAAQPNPLAARARYDLALIDLEHGDRAAGIARLHDMIVHDPASNVAGLALRRYLDEIDDERGAEGRLAELAALLPQLSASALDEPLRYEQARLLASTEQLEPALAAYLELAQRHPYPYGAHWDDALWYAAALEERLGRPQAAITQLERMLSARESSDFVGSYERPRYGEARFRMAELIRDELHDSARAREEFWRVYKRHPNSLLRDDALWEAAKISQSQHDSAGTCSLLRTLQSELADSRYAACAPLLCPDLAKGAGAHRCAPYIARTLASSPTP
jgi:hypothetical protein